MHSGHWLLLLAAVLPQLLVTWRSWRHHRHLQSVHANTMALCISVGPRQPVCAHPTASRPPYKLVSEVSQTGVRLPDACPVATRYSN